MPMSNLLQTRTYGYNMLAHIWTTIPNLTISLSRHSSFCNPSHFPYNTSYDQNWNPDIGATSHITSNLNNLTLNANTNIGPNQVQVGNDQSLHILHTGPSILYSSMKSFFLNNILHVPEIKKNLQSVYQFIKDNNVYFEFHSSFFYVKDPSLAVIFLHGWSNNDLYPILSHLPPPIQLHTLVKESWFLNGMLTFGTLP